LGLLNNITVRSANKHDFAGIQNLVESLELSESLLTDVKQYNKAHRDEVSRRSDFFSHQNQKISPQKSREEFLEILKASSETKV